jgi:hypothetical protein
MADRTEGLTDPDDAPPVPEHPVSQTGDLWLLGQKRQHFHCACACARPRASRLGKSKTVAGRQGRAVGD